MLFAPCQVFNWPPAATSNAAIDRVAAELAAQIGDDFSPIPAVKTNASRPLNAAAAMPAFNPERDRRNGRRPVSRVDEDLIAIADPEKALETAITIEEATIEEATIEEVLNRSRRHAFFFRKQIEPGRIAHGYPVEGA
jgi:hypothetical protein